MTKKELEKEAEEIYQKTDKEFMDCQDEGEIFNLGYLAGAESREKEIKILGERCLQLQKDKGNLIDRVAELEQKLEQIKNEKFEKALSQVKHDREVVIEYNERLQKENTELKDCFKIAKDNEYEYQSLFTKAKEIIREFVEWATWQGSNCPSFKSIQDKAEHFLKEDNVSEHIQRATHNYIN